jgi:hypothetical protein
MFVALRMTMRAHASDSATPPFQTSIGIHGPEGLPVDLALDPAPGRPAMARIAGPTFAPAELAGRKGDPAVRP